MQIDTLPLKDIITIGAAAIGAVLGVMNTWNGMNQRRVRLRVRPGYAFPIPASHPMITIEVINVSTFPVTIEEVGFSRKWHRPNKGARMPIIPPILNDGKPWPRRLEPRESVSTYGYLNELAAHGEHLGKAYARTSCGEWVVGDSPALKQLREELKSQK